MARGSTGGAGGVGSLPGVALDWYEENLSKAQTDAEVKRLREMFQGGEIPEEVVPLLPVPEAIPEPFDPDLEWQEAAKARARARRGGNLPWMAPAPSSTGFYSSAAKVPRVQPQHPPPSLSPVRAPGFLANPGSAGTGLSQRPGPGPGPGPMIMDSPIHHCAPAREVLPHAPAAPFDGQGIWSGVRVGGAGYVWKRPASEAAARRAAPSGGAGGLGCGGASLAPAGASAAAASSREPDPGGGGGFMRAGPIGKRASLGPRIHDGLFDTVDQNSDGVITRAEFLKAALGEDYGPPGSPGDASAAEARSGVYNYAYSMVGGMQQIREARRQEELRKHDRRVAAVTRLQSWFRALMKKLAFYKKKARCIAAVILVQNRYRGKAAQADAAARKERFLKQRAIESAAILVLQTRYRAKTATASVALRIGADASEVAVPTPLPAVIGLRTLRRKEQEAREEKAILFLQSRYRGVKTMQGTVKQLVEHRKKERLILMIQSMCRRFKAIDKVQDLQVAELMKKKSDSDADKLLGMLEKEDELLAAQERLRRFEEKLLTRRRAAVTIQRCWRKSRWRGRLAWEVEKQLLENAYNRAAAKREQAQQAVRDAESAREEGDRRKDLEQNIGEEMIVRLELQKRVVEAREEVAKMEQLLRMRDAAEQKAARFDSDCASCTLQKVRVMSLSEALAKVCTTTVRFASRDPSHGNAVAAIVQALKEVAHIREDLQELAEYLIRWVQAATYGAGEDRTVTYDEWQGKTWQTSWSRDAIGRWRITEYKTVEAPEEDEYERDAEASFADEGTEEMQATPTSPA
eukprot:TRINITY_DN15778_c0_g2_i1.p1 TRINITY_DN15778_c0_g2~~TRINITY_DN15778_c0_g2_i1.p1  ORF type:complete len:804 (+),score=170.37 TRINITY_DN15778_c0_g2_i1:143-2554(+)